MLGTTISGKILGTAFAITLTMAVGAAQLWPTPQSATGEGATAVGRDSRAFELPFVEVELASALVAFDDCEAMASFARAAALERIGPWGLDGGQAHLVADAVAMERAVADDSGSGGTTVGGVGGGGAAAEPMPASADGGGRESGSDYSATNVQERGVDEPDIVKSDGRLLATVTHNRLHLVDVTAGAPRLRSSTRLPQGWGHELLLDGDRLLVLSTTHRDPAPAQRSGGRDGLQIMPIGEPLAVLTLLDIADPAAPSTVGTLEVTGEYVSARLTEGVARVVLRSRSQPPLVAPTDGGQAGQARAERRNREIVAASSAEDWLPRFRTDAPGGGSSGAVVACDAVRHPETFAGFGMTTLLALDLAEGVDPVGTASVMADVETVYATPDRLYVAINRMDEIPARGRTGAASRSSATALRAVPEPVEPLIDPATPEEPFSEKPAPEPDDEPRPAPDEPVSDEPMPGEPMMVPGPRISLRTTTAVHEFDTSDPRAPVYTASGEVPGRLLNQWALSRHDGHLRVATTVGDPWGPEPSESAVTILRREGPALAPVGIVAGLGLTERIYAVRYVGDVAYVVTFRETDPLYTLDLSDPTAPRLLGELKIPGYSSYLHPIGDGLVIGIGQDASDDGMRLGTQVSLFDVSDLTAPQRLHHLTLDEHSSSEAEHDHRAFLWWRGRVVVPYQHWRGFDEATQTEDMFLGVVSLAVDRAAGIRQAGRISHAGHTGTDPYLGHIRRTVAIGDLLYTVSEAGVMASDAGSLAERAWLALPR